MHLPDIAALGTTVTRSISPENPTGAKAGGGRATEGTGARFATDLGRGWKISPSVDLPPGGTHVLADLSGPGRITHIWLTTDPGSWRRLLLRASWDGSAEPAIEVPVGDFFGQGWGQFAQLSSQMVAVNPHGGFNSYWPMPFSDGALLTLENLAEQPVTVYYQVTYDVGPDVVADGRLHAQWCRSNPLETGRTHVLLDEVRGRGHYAGTYLAWGVNARGWWGEGEIKFYLDGDRDSTEPGGPFATIVGTGTEDYLGGAWDFSVPGQGYTSYSTPYLGLHQIIRPDGQYESQQRFGMYRWHVLDPIRFERDLTADIQALGWRSDRKDGRRYLQRHDDIASTAFFYLDAPSTNRPATPTHDELETL
ncbi:DUF2961 domain-containing protein [Ruania suaedae]|uniref:glycoside hydrolase family 172 protein n=1 Tax=Ruania suaedae TaxID=2897774 RepID=UPI001E33E7FB|nr:glycoside hydrolase family 172 protein [Ruania suaedae]UFU03313.1 DUF2961 domain-containing protein [Ruania suaedae]